MHNGIQTVFSEDWKVNWAHGFTLCNRILHAMIYVAQNCYEVSNTF